MNGPEHYAEAERLLEIVAGYTDSSGVAETAQAQVHATLALAAATLYPNLPGDVNTGWAGTLGHVSQPKPPDPWGTP